MNRRLLLQAAVAEAASTTTKSIKRTGRGLRNETGCRTRLLLTRAAKTATCTPSSTGRFHREPQRATLHRHLMKHGGPDCPVIARAATGAWSAHLGHCKLLRRGAHTLFACGSDKVERVLRSVERPTSSVVVSGADHHPNRRGALRRPGDAHLARDALHLAIRAGQGCAGRAHSATAHRPIPSTRTTARQRTLTGTWSDPSDGVDPRSARAR